MDLSSDPDTLIRGFCAAWDVKDLELVMAHFTDDAVWHNIPMAPVNGKDAIAKAIGGFMAGDGSVRFEIVHQVASDTVVMNERIDYIDMGDVKIEAKVCGVFELVDGKIAQWREYFDAKQASPG